MGGCFMRKNIIIFILLSISLIGCQQEEIGDEVTEELNDREGKPETLNVTNDKYITFTTDDEMVEFTLVNNDNFSNERLNKVKKETLNAYKEILKLTNSHLEKKKEIMIEMYKGEGVSLYTTGGAIKLYIQENKPYPLVHELTHALLDYDRYKASYLTLDGLAMNLEEKITGQISWPPVPPKYSLDQFMYHLNQKNLYIPITLLADPEVANEINTVYDADSTRWLLYVESYSFTKYMIETHGIELYMKIYNSHQLKNDIQEVYGKSFENLENDWLEYLNSKNKGLDIKLKPNSEKNFREDINKLLEKHSYEES